MFVQSRADVRQTFAEVWRKLELGTPLQPLEALIAEVIRMHPEYHAVFDDAAQLAQDYVPERGRTNPFLHMGLHIALHEQLQADRPAGIAAIHRRLRASHGDPHRAEHAMIDCLAEALWQAQREARLPDERAYLDCLRRL